MLNDYGQSSRCVCINALSSCIYLFILPSKDQLNCGPLECRKLINSKKVSTKVSLQGFHRLKPVETLYRCIKTPCHTSWLVCC